MHTRKRIAVLSDIHSNLLALEAVLLDLSDKEIDGFIFAGDYITDGPNPNEVMDRIRNLNGWMIKGNREDYILDIHNDTKKLWRAYKQASVLGWTYEQLSSEHVAFISQLPDQEVVKIEGCDPIRVVHGSIESSTELVFQINKERLKELTSTMEEKVLVYGHTHRPWNGFIGDTLVVNSGSVGLAFNGYTSAEYAILTWENGKWHGANYQVAYDAHKFYEQCCSLGLAHVGGAWTRAVIESVMLGVNICIAFIHHAKKIAMEQGHDNYTYIPNQVWNKAESTFWWRVTDRLKFCSFEAEKTSANKK